MGKSRVHAAAARIAATLTEANIPFAIAGALAVNEHGHVRMTDDVNILLTPDGLERFKALRLDRGWIEKSPGSRRLVDTVNDVSVGVILTGDYPGDRKPKPVAFPHPAEASEPGSNGLPVLRLPDLLMLKIASGMTAPHRLGDLADVIALISKNGLDREYAQLLHPYVREKYLELWPLAQVQDDY